MIMGRWGLPLGEYKVLMLLKSAGPEGLSTHDPRWPASKSLVTRMRRRGLDIRAIWGRYVLCTDVDAEIATMDPPDPVPTRAENQRLIAWLEAAVKSGNGAVVTYEELMLAGKTTRAAMRMARHSSPLNAHLKVIEKVGIRWAE